MCENFQEKAALSKRGASVARYQSDVTSGSASSNNTGAEVLHSTVKSSPTTVLLKTAVAPDYSSGTYIDAKILMDEGHGALL